MKEINIYFDKWKNQTIINDETLNEGIKVGLHQEFIWKGTTYIIVHTEDEIWKHHARGLEKDMYIESLKVNK